MAVDIDGVNSTISTDKLIPQSGTALQIGESGDTVTLVGSAVGFGGGKVLQIQTALTSAYTSTTASVPFDDSIFQNTEGAELVTLSFTPLSSASKLLFIFGGHFNMGTGGSVLNPLPIALFVDTTADAFATGTATVDGGGTRVMSIWTFHLEANASTSARTYKMRWSEGEGSGTAYVNGDTSARKFGGKLASGFYVIEFEN